jgi:hypothetical protein
MLRFKWFEEDEREKGDRREVRGERWGPSPGDRGWVSKIPYLLFTLLQCVANVSYVLSQQLFLSVAAGLVITPVIFFRTSVLIF